MSIRPKILLLTVGILLAVTAVDERACAATGYLFGHEVDYRSVVGPPPAQDSAWDHADEQLVEALQSVDDARQQSAKLDEEELYPRFAEAFGRTIDTKHSPVLVAMLDRAVSDANWTAGKAKDRYQRPRPYQRLQLQHTCDKTTAPKPEDHAVEGTSYPSGHSTRGWTVAMVLARVAPDRAEALMKRAEEYEESRLICGMHFPTDVQAGQSVAEAVVGHLDAARNFQTDLARARKEYAAAASH
jgi:acid phosphatase (class A)